MPAIRTFPPGTKNNSAEFVSGEGCYPYPPLKSSEEFFRLNYLAGANGSKVKSLAGPLMGENGGD